MQRVVGQSDVVVVKVGSLWLPRFEHVPLDFVPVGGDWLAER